MFEQRFLIKNIPAGKFHSVLMTSFSINLYYWEIQLLKTLSDKGIHFVSALVDSNCLSDQLFKFSKAFSHKKPLEFSLHGYKSKGAFHPKIQFYAGGDNILILIGSGNLTFSGHGKNMEVWSSVMIDDANSPAYPFVREVWRYLTDLYQALGDEASNIIHTIEENCRLLQGDCPTEHAEYPINSDCSIRLFVDGDKTLFQQCDEWIGAENIKSITVMSPFYDSQAELVKALYERFKPETMNIIVEKNFGAVPKSQSIPDYINIYSWEHAIPKDKPYQKFFHSKCFFLTGGKHNYLICGSANASVAAFGIPGVPSTNREANVGYKSATTDYLAESGLRLDNSISPAELEGPGQIRSNKGSSRNSIVWIKEASYGYGRYTVKTQNEQDVTDATITFYSGDRQVSEFVQYQAKAGEYSLEGFFKDATFNPLYAEITDRHNNLISNRQYVIPLFSMEYNDPSPANMAYRKGCHAIESGQLVNRDLLQFVRQILSTDTESPSGHTSRKYQAIQSGQTENGIKEGKAGITETSKSRMDRRFISQFMFLSNSIISYLNRSFKEKQEEEIDNEETEDIRTSEGRDASSNTARPSLKRETADNNRMHVVKMLDKYIAQIEPIAWGEAKPAPIDMTKALEKFMIVIFLLDQILSYRYTTKKNPDENQSLLDIPYSIYKHQSATEYVHRIINLFALYVCKCEVKEVPNGFIKTKLERYKQKIFELCIAVISICDWLNEGNIHYTQIQDTKEATFRNIQMALNGSIQQLEFEVYKLLDRSVQNLEGFDRGHMKSIISRNVSIMARPFENYPQSDILYTSEFGYVTLSSHKKPKTAIPQSLAFPYNKNRMLHSPNYLYQITQMRLYKIAPKK